MPRLRPVIEPKIEPPKPERQIIPHEEEIDHVVETAEPDKPEVIVEEAPEPSRSADLALKKQIEELRKSEEAQRTYADQLRREREEAVRLAAEQARKLVKVQRDTLEHEEVAIDSTLAAAKAASEKALSDYKNALDAGDNAAAAEAMDRLTDAKADLRIVERGREELKAKRKDLKKERRKLEEQQEAAAQAPAVPSGDPVDGWGLPPAESDWLKANRDYYMDKGKAADLKYIHEKTMLKGLVPGMPAYLPEIKKGLVSLGHQLGQPEPEIETNETQQRASIMSAPVSRESQGSGGQRPSATRITLTKEEKEYAAISGISEVEYAKQKQRLEKEKAAGNYGERR